MLVVTSENAESVVAMAYAGPWFCTCVARLIDLATLMLQV